MKRLQDLFLAAVVLMPLHIVEQLLFGIDELYELRMLTAALVNSFSDPDYGAVVLVGAVTTLVLYFCYGFLAGGLPRFLAAGFFGLEFMGESHHLVKTVLHAEYFPGTVSAIALAVLGGFVLSCAWREFRGASREKPARSVAAALGV